MKPVKLVRITTVPISLRLLLTGQPEYMQQNGFHVILISADGDDWEHVLNKHPFEHYKVDMARQISLKKDFQALFTLIKLFRKIKPDIVHSHTPKAGLLAMMAAKICGVPIRIHTLAGMPLMTVDGLKRNVLDMAERLTYQCSTEVWPNSGQLMKFILDNRMISKGKARMILHGSSNGIDISKYSHEKLSPERLQEIRNEWNIKENDFIFLAVGRVVKDKGIEELVEAFGFINQQYPQTRLFILGPFEEANAVSDEVKKAIQNHKNIVHISWSDEVEYFMALAKCFVHASHREGFPNVVLQAGAMGTPIILSDITGNIDIVENDAEGNIYPVKNKQALIDKMVFVLNNYLASLKKAETLQQKVVTSFDRKAVFRAIKTRYLQLLNSKNIDVQGINKADI